MSKEKIPGTSTSIHLSRGSSFKNVIHLGEVISYRRWTRNVDREINWCPEGMIGKSATAELIPRNFEVDEVHRKWSLGPTSKSSSSNDDCFLMKLSEHIAPDPDIIVLRLRELRHRKSSSGSNASLSLGSWRSEGSLYATTTSIRNNLTLRKEDRRRRKVESRDLCMQTLSTSLVTVGKMHCAIRYCKDLVTSSWTKNLRTFAH